MTPRGRRRFDVVLIVLVAGVAAAVAAIGAVVGDAERIPQIWTAARIGAEGGADVVEVIDYDFGLSIDRHGIFRDVPGLPLDAAVEVSSPSAPDQFVLLPSSDGDPDETQIRIGDPASTITGRHRYRIGYTLFTLTPGSSVAWDAVGADWEAPITRAEIHLLTPFEVVDARCFRGATGSTDPCEIEALAPGHLRAVVGPLDAQEGVTIEGRAGTLLDAAPPVPDVPPAPADPGSGIRRPAGLAALAFVVAALPVSIVVRRRGREKVGAGGPTDAAHADATGDFRLLDITELQEMATTEFAPPEGITPSMGGVVLAETVRHEHKVAWLIGCAIDGYIELDPDGDDGRKDKNVTLRRLERDDGEAARVLNTGFGGRSTITLGKYDSRFASMWNEVGSRLELWQRESGYWDPAGTRRRTIVRVLGVLAMIPGAVVTAAGAGFANRWGDAWLPVCVAGAVLFGAGWAACLRAWELKVRTPAGSAMWLRVESFRRFLHGSEAFHAEQAAQRGVLREYTAWAVAVGEVDRWSRAVEAATDIPDDAGLGYVYMAPALGAMTSSTSTAPSSSGSGGGGGGGSVGGGGGGGGGGSW